MDQGFELGVALSFMRFLLVVGGKSKWVGCSVGELVQGLGFAAELVMAVELAVVLPRGLALAVGLGLVAELEMAVELPRELALAMG